VRIVINFLFFFGKNDKIELLFFFNNFLILIIFFKKYDYNIIDLFDLNNFKIFF
jgi:hypothetical protein